MEKLNPKVKELIDAFYTYEDTYDMYGALMNTLFMVCEELYFTHEDLDLVTLVAFLPGNAADECCKETRDNCFFQDYIQPAQPETLTAFGRWLHDKIEALPEDKKY